jgi:hypothetical protein
MKRRIYIAHPIGGDVVGNLMSLFDIIRYINLNEPDVIPCAPYVADVMAMGDTIPENRKRGMENGLELIRSGVFHELRAYGLSDGVYAEIKAAHDCGITIRVMPMDAVDWQITHRVGG